MATQNYVITGQIVVTNGTMRNIVSLTDQTNTTSSNAISNNQNVATGSWQALDTGSNATFRFGYFCNTDATSSLLIALGNTASNASVLLPGDFCILTGDGSATAVYIQASGSKSPVQLQYIYAGK